METLKHFQLANMIQMSLPICATYGTNHQSSECPLATTEASLPEQAACAQNFQRQQNNPYSQTYNPRWRNHPNFSYSNTQMNIQIKENHKKENKDGKKLSQSY
ncbi:Uncharacterized protein Adt_14429 [Abeliophyllum distichum]|uniref:Uncharacterized protein n=1 Tax=Abeliophyllum distichum TaxID=126358 RepID=A0ABD1TZM3_9LAMI